MGWRRCGRRETTVLNDIWFAFARKLLPKERVTRVCNLAWFIVGLHTSQPVHLSRIAAKLPFLVRLRSVQQRLNRFLSNTAFQVRSWYRPVAQALLAYWKLGEDEPWLLATNLPAATTTLRAYRYRMWIEEMFGDWKGHGLDLERTRLGHFLRLTRLTFAVALWYLWLVLAS